MDSRLLSLTRRQAALVTPLLKDQHVLARIDAADKLPTGGSAADVARFSAAESANNARIIRAAGLTAER